MTLSRLNSFLFRALAILSVVGGLVVVYICARGPSTFPEPEQLIATTGIVVWTQPDDYGIAFRLADDRRTYSYARKSGDIATVEAALKSPASQPVTVSVLPHHQGWAGKPFYDVYAFGDSRGPIRTLTQVRQSWASDYKFGYLAALMLFMAAAYLEYIVRRSQPNNSFKALGVAMEVLRKLGRTLAATQDSARFAAVLAPDGFSVGADFFAWSEIVEVVAYKQDLITTDEAFLEFRANGRCLAVSEEQPGFAALEQAAIKQYPGVAGWRDSVIQPAFARNYITLYRRT